MVLMRASNLQTTIYSKVRMIAHIFVLNPVSQTSLNVWILIEHKYRKKNDDLKTGGFGLALKQIHKAQATWINMNTKKALTTEKTWLETFSGMLCCLIGLTQLLKTPITPLYWLKLTGISFQNKPIVLRL